MDRKDNFNPRPRKEGDTFTFRDYSVVDNFNPRPRKEGDTFTFRDYSVVDNFNPRPRKEGDNFLSNAVQRKGLFQSTPS